MDSVPDAVAALSTRNRILVFTGAGISTESGIPDFRGPNGVWTRIDPSEFTFDKWLTRPETRRKAWAMRAESGTLDAEPNDGHRAIAALWESGLLVGVVTQNIDGLHAAAGLPPSALVEIHGNARTVGCLECSETWPTETVIDWVRAGDPDPHCPDCGGIIKSTTISFGQQLEPTTIAQAYAWAEACDAVLAVGSTLSVYPAADVPASAARRGAPYVIINRGPTDHDHLCDIRLEGGAGEILTALSVALTRQSPP